MPTIGAESHTVDWLLVFSQCVDTDASLHVPETNCGVKWCTVEGDKDKLGYESAAAEQIVYFNFVCISASKVLYLALQSSRMFKIYQDLWTATFFFISQDKCTVLAPSQIY